MTELVESSMTRRDFFKGVVAGAVVAAIAAIGIEELRISGMKDETTTQTTTTTTTLPGTTSTVTSTTTAAATTITSTTTVPGPTTTQTVTSTKTVGEVPAVALAKEITLNVNGEDYEVEVENRTSLLEVLNNELSMSGAKDGCNEGVCGSCTVLVDGVPALSCMMLAGDAEGKAVTTVEGLSDGIHLHPIQEAFAEQDGFQCGFCTPGLILVTKALLEGTPNPTEEDVRYAIGGNLCKCGAYNHIVKSILAAAG